MQETETDSPSNLVEKSEVVEDSLKDNSITHAKNSVGSVAPTPKFQKQPEWFRFAPEETIPLKGYNFKVLGVTDKQEMVLAYVGPTSRTLKERAEAERKKRRS